MDEINSFLGTGWSFPPQFSKTEKTVKTISDEEDIKNSLEVLLATRVGERLMQPKYGCNLDVLLFEPIDTALKTYIKDLVFTSIFYYEPRVKPDDVILSALAEEGNILIEVKYTIRATNTRHNLVYPFYLEEGTLVK
ncbi:MAG TPA: GPW/gp25 family protein [Bacteroidales bacterium]|nr:GPW/gp25 family protein [Bacteroidales bacterium]HPS18202.1 GPW/gp25 family protein [Bacteroidales bacterium]